MISAEIQSNLVEHVRTFQVHRADDWVYDPTVREFVQRDSSKLRYSIEQRDSYFDAINMRGVDGFHEPLKYMSNAISVGSTHQASRHVLLEAAVATVLTPELDDNSKALLLNAWSEEVANGMHKTYSSSGVALRSLVDYSDLYGMTYARNKPNRIIGRLQLANLLDCIEERSFHAFVKTPVQSRRHRVAQALHRLGH